MQQSEEIIDITKGSGNVKSYVWYISAYMDNNDCFVTLQNLQLGENRTFLK